MKYHIGVDVAVELDKTVIAIQHNGRTLESFELPQLALKAKDEEIKILKAELAQVRANHAKVQQAYRALKAATLAARYSSGFLTSNPFKWPRNISAGGSYADIGARVQAMQQAQQFDDLSRACTEAPTMQPANPAPAAPEERMPARHGKPWNRIEEEGLLYRWKVLGKSLTTIAALHERHPDAIVRRLAKLGGVVKSSYLSEDDFVARWRRYYFDRAGRPTGHASYLRRPSYQPEFCK